MENYHLVMALMLENIGKPMGKSSEWWFNGGLMGFCGVYPLLSSKMASWKIDELNGGLNRKITEKWSMFHCYV